MARRLIHRGDLRGAARLATEGTAGLADLVEAVHERIARWPGAAPPARPGRTRGITGLVYKSVRGVTRLAGGGVDALLGLLVGEAPQPAEPVPGREALRAALNGVLGDHLEASGNPLAIAMALRHQGRPVAAGLPAAGLPAAGPRMLVLVHGLCMNDLQWCRNGHDHGQMLAEALGFTPLYLHYNSGRSIGANGRDFAACLEALLPLWPGPLERIVILAHSMGGLVARSALHQAAQAGQRWPGRVSDLVMLGTPHHGAPLERAGHWVDGLLAATPHAAPFARLTRLRSAGITDLRHGRVLPGDGRKPEDSRRDRGPPVPLPAGVRCHAVAGRLGSPGGGIQGRLLGDGLVGDGLVPLASALGRHRDPRWRLAFAADRQWVAQGVGHMALLDDAAVAAQLLRWLSGPPATGFGG